MHLCYLNRFLQLCTCCHRRFNHFLVEREIGKKWWEKSVSLQLSLFSVLSAQGILCICFCFYAVKSEMQIRFSFRAHHSPSSVFEHFSSWGKIFHLLSHAASVLGHQPIKVATLGPQNMEELAVWRDCRCYLSFLSPFGCPPNLPRLCFIKL